MVWGLGGGCGGGMRAGVECRFLPGAVRMVVWWLGVGGMAPGGGGSDIAAGHPWRASDGWAAGPGVNRQSTIATGGAGGGVWMGAVGTG